MDRRRFIKPSVRRCLFGRPTNCDDFLAKQKRLELEEELRFSRKWNLDNKEENEYQWSKASTDIPEFYTNGYSHKCRRRDVKPCVGKSLSFADDNCEDMRASSPVQYCDTSTVEVLMGILPHQPPQEPVTPKNSDFDDAHLSKSEDTKNSVDDMSSVPRLPSELLRERLIQRRLTDTWRIVKKRPRSLESGHIHKRARIGRRL